MNAAAKVYLTPQEVSDRIKFSVGTLANWRTQGKGPDYVRQGRRIRYPEEAIERFMSEPQVA
ncbi:helix-turn-helix domain-containing protein [Leifsonia sp. 71-9]|uniref:helix-turn-helix domain-containing protein n=1 Tax=Leifsonia sp. 71-9 TaxID=1895934 RepID=UPI0009272B0C|nr:helix-turn-helix domain-containing protein [Leifsonia sp. 71-9]OJX72803.1 MAG: hypothetical protein BGO91_13615 [Leifsonia sp. 71-9]